MSLSCARSARPRGRPDLPRGGLRRRGRDLRRGGVRHRDDRLPGDAHRPVVPPPGRGDDRSAHRQHRPERRGPRVLAGSGWPATSSATPPGSRRAGAPGARLDDELREQGVVGISRHRHPRADPPPARARRDAGRHLHRPSADPEALLARVRDSGEMAGADLSAEVSTAEAYVVPAPSGENDGSRVAALDLGHQGDHAPDDGRARHRDPRPAGDRHARRRARASARRAVLLQRPRRPGRDDRAGRAAAGGARARPALLRDLLRQPALRPGARLRAPTSSPTATAGSTSR